jgi:hypothetical protein
MSIAGSVADNGGSVNPLLEALARLERFLFETFVRFRFS